MNNNRTVRWRQGSNEKMRWNATKKNGRNFQYKKFSVIDLVLTDRRNAITKATF